MVGGYKSFTLASRVTANIVFLVDLFIFRVQEDRDIILKPLCLRLDQQNQITILLPKMETDLYHVFRERPNERRDHANSTGDRPSDG